MDAVVLGAAGFIGSRMTQLLANEGMDVLAIDIVEPDTPTRWKAWNSAANRQIVDLSEAKPNLMGAPEVYNFAADMGGVGYFHRHDYWPYLYNSRITFNVLDAATEQNTGLLFMASSACVYPIELQQDPAAVPLLHEALIETGQPDQMYGREKLMMLRLAERAPIDARVGIFHGIYGIGQEKSGERMKFPTAIATKTLAARDTGTVEIWGDGSQMRSFLWIDDAISKVRAMMRGENPGPLNVGRQGARSVFDLAKMCADIAGINPQFIFQPNEPSGVLARDCDNSRFWKLYGEMEPTTYEDGFESLMVWLDEEASK